MKVIGFLLPIALAVGIMGCEDKIEDKIDDPAGVPSTPPSIRGLITTMTLPWVRVEEKPDEASGSAKASVRVMGTTKVLRRDGSVTSATELRVGQRVKVWFTGPVAESYPVQATADVIVIE